MQLGDYIGFVDSDDYISKETYSTLLNKEIVTKNNPDLIRFQLQSEKGDIITKRITDVFGYYDISDDKSVVFDLLINKCQVANAVCCLYKKELLDNIRFNTDIKYGEDYLFNFNVFCKAKSLYIDDGIYYHYIQNLESATHIIDPQKILRRLNNHFDVDYYVYTKVIELKKYDAFYASTLNTTVRAVTTVLKLIAKGLSYEEYSKVIDEFILADYYKRYIALPNNEENINKLKSFTDINTRKNYYDEFKNA